MGKAWGAPTSWDEVCRRNAGRARYHAMRRAQRELRRLEVVKLLRRWGHVQGVQAMIARELQVSEATVSRDVRALLGTLVQCPMCESFVERDQLEGGG
jgi:predicted DNA-binding transcriptional regulator YafY